MTLAATLIIIGRIILGGFFTIAGIRNFLHFAERRKLATNYGWTLPAPLTALGFAVQLAAGVLLIVGLWTALAAAALIVFLVCATELFHNFLLFQGKDRDPHLYLTLVNTTLIGTCLLVIGTSI